jgi:hypothetical protein
MVHQENFAELLADQPESAEPVNVTNAQEYLNEKLRRQSVHLALASLLASCGDNRV